MSLEGWETDLALGEAPCKTDRESWQCKNMKTIKGDLDMYYEHYHCQVCGRRESLDYDEMR
jgi:hypothetical protein